MIPSKHYKTKAINQADHDVYLKKAKEFYQTMYQAEKVENWNAVGLNGVHCVISLIDAILVRHAGIRSTGTDHMAVINLLTAIPAVRIKDVVQKAQSA